MKTVKLLKKFSEKPTLINLFEIEDNYTIDDNEKIKYNETIFFNREKTKKKEEKANINDEHELQKIIDNVLNSKISKADENKSSIKFNVNINNNYYNSNYNYVVNPNSVSLKPEANNQAKEENKKNENGVTGFLKRIFNFASFSSPASTEVNAATPSTNNISLYNQTETNFPRDTVTSVMNSEPNMSKKSHSSSSANYMFIPCINCNNLIHMDEIENHSNICTRVREEVIVAESSQFTYYTIDFKLKKLQEHITIIKNLESGKNSEFQKDMHNISLLLQYINNSINVSKIDHKAISDMKKILTNIDTLIITHKGSMSASVLIERTRVLVYEKISIFKEDYKKLIQTKKSNERRSGTINSLQILEKQKEEKQMLADKLEVEKEMMQRKVNNLKQSPEERRSAILSRDDSLLKDLEQEDEETEVNNKINSRKIYNRRNIVEDISSDVENLSSRSVQFSDCTSMSSSDSVASINDHDLSKGNLRHSNNNSTISSDAPDVKKLYREFVKIMLKVKFEKFNNSHSGQKIPEKVLFKECIKQNIPKSDWTDFIIGELHQHTKYLKSESKLKGHRKTLTGLNMEMIREEN